MNIQKLLICLLVINFWQFASADDCPQTEGESQACLLENVKVSAAVMDLTPKMMMKVCGQNPGKTYACRALVFYFDSEGKFSDDVFEEWFIGSPNTKDEVQYRSFMVKNASGLYDAFWADNFVGDPQSEFRITSSDPNQKDVTVGWSKDGYPVYDFHYNFASGDKPPVRGLITYSARGCSIKKYNPDNGEEIETLVYPLYSMQWFYN